MGTNFYIRKKLSNKLKEEAIAALQKDEYQEVKNILSEVNDIHIGKRSGGWKFLFNANNFNYFKPTKESFIEFLKSGQIVDEYDREYTFDQFWDEEIPYGNNLLDITSYYDTIGINDKYKPREELYIIDRFKKEWNINVNIYGEFYIDDLRFTTTTNFC